MTIATNSSTLISLAKIGRLDMLKEMKSEIISPEFVYKETVEEGKRKQIMDALLIEKVFVENTIKTRKIEKKFWNKVKKTLGRELNEGDHSVVSLAIQTNANEVLTDDDNLARVVETLGMKSVSSADIILVQLKDKKINLNEFQELIRDLVFKNRINQKIAEEYLKRGEEIEKR